MLLSDLQWERIGGDWMPSIKQFKLFNKNNSSLYNSNTVRWNIEKTFVYQKIDYNISVCL